MQDSVFALAPSNGFLYWTPKCWRRQNLDAELEEALSGHTKIYWAAFGPGQENYVVSYADADGSHYIAWGDSTSSDLLTWLVGENRDTLQTDPQLRVTLGPNNSFFAWDSKRVRWQNIPQSLEKVVQGWLSPAGWTCGPPRIVTLGAEGSYFALSEYRATAHRIPTRFGSLRAVWDELKAKRESGDFKWDDLEHAYFDSVTSDCYVLCFKDNSSLDFRVNAPQPLESFHICFENLLLDDEAQEWRRRRKKKRPGSKGSAEDSQKARQQQGGAGSTEEQDQKEARQARARAAEEQLRRLEEERKLEDLRHKYVVWRNAWEEDLLRKRMLTLFPHLPIAVCTCDDLTCTSRKMPGSLMACQHDVEKFLRASGLYSGAWLRKERLVWHPDRFGQRCDPDFREELKMKATALYAIFEVLIEAEKEREESGDTSSF